jgi:hypothetical protein
MALTSGASWMKPLAAIVMLVCSTVAGVGCSHVSDDFMVTGRRQQRVTLRDASEVVIRRDCPDRQILPSKADGALVIDARGRYGSLGYHGDQDKPRSMPDDLMDFATTREGARVILQSREFAYMHHRHLLTKVQVRAPRGVRVRFEPRSQDAP